GSRSCPETVHTSSVRITRAISILWSWPVFCRKKRSTASSPLGRVTSLAVESCGGWHAGSGWSDRNHQSYLDPLVMASILPKETFYRLFAVGTSDIFGGGIMRRLARWIRVV